MSRLIGLTGPTGAGKSTLAKKALEMGIQVIDCDKVAREAVVKGSGGLYALTKAFGSDILLLSGELDRKALSKKAFKCKEYTELLNKTLLPFIVDLVKQKINGDTVLLDAPTLFESELWRECAFTVAVLAEPQIRLKRIIERDNISESEASLRMSAGKPDDFYINNADYIIYNNGDGKKLTEEFTKLLGGK